MTPVITMAAVEDRAAIMSFIDDWWARGHVLATSTRLFDWQYGARAAAGYNVVIARQGAEILGILGFINTADIDDAQGRDGTVWLALWKVREGAPAGLGLRLLRHLERSVPHAALGVLGIGDPRHLAMYRALGFHTGECTQHVLTSRTRPLTLVQLPAGIRRPTGKPGVAALRPLDPADVDAALEGLASDALPLKTAAYLRRRYLDHPVYSYAMHVVVVDGAPPSAVVVSRVATAGGARVVRIVDCAGDVTVLSEAGAAVGDLVEEAGAEHADLWVAGVDGSIPEAAGFAAVDPDGPLVVPGYLEPLVRSNIRLRYAFRSPRPFRLFRGDGDQDRPNMLQPAK